MDKCPGLMGGLNDPSTSCNIQCPVNEVISGTLSKLPGNNPIGPWGVPASPPAGGSSGTTPAAPVTNPTTTAAAGGESSPSGGGAAAENPNTVGGAATSPVAAVETVSVLPLEASSSAVAGDSTTFQTAFTSSTTTLFSTVPAAATSTAVASSSGGDPVPGWTYYGCYTDKLASGERVMSGITFANVGQHAVTNTKCTAYCGARGYSMAGTEYGGQCFCANVIVGSSKVDDSLCNMPCEGDGSQTCGGSLTLSVYTASGSTKRSHRHLHRHIHGAKN